MSKAPDKAELEELVQLTSQRVFMHVRIETQAGIPGIGHPAKLLLRGQFRPGRVPGHQRPE